jgi:phage terminase large subunit-like protein
MDSSTETPEAPVDRATDYARRVVAGEIVAGPWVRLACKRHLDDLLVGHLRGLTYDLAEVERAVRFYEQVLKLNGGDFEGKPFVLLPWQKFVVGSIFGWMARTERAASGSATSRPRRAPASRRSPPVSG